MRLLTIEQLVVGFGVRLKYGVRLTRICGHGYRFTCSKEYREVRIQVRLLYMYRDEYKACYDSLNEKRCLKISILL